MTNAPDTIATHPPTGTEEPDPKRWLALAVIAVAQLMVILDSSIVNIALPSAQKALHITNADRQWMVTAYTLSFGSLLLLGGRIADYTGRKRAFVIGLLGFAASSALGGLAVERPDALRGPCPPGRLRRPPRSGRALPHHRDLHRGPGALHRLRRLRGHRRRRRGDRPDHGRRPHPVRLVALVPVRQRADRHRDRRRRPAHRPGEPGHGQHQLRHPGHGHGHRRPGGAGLRVHPGRTGRLDLTQHADLPGRRRGAAGRLRRHRGPVGQPAAAHADPARPQPRWLLPVRLPGRFRAPRDVPLPHVLLPGNARVLGPEGRVRVPALLDGDHPGRRGRLQTPPPVRTPVHDDGWVRRRRPRAGLAQPDHARRPAIWPTCSRPSSSSAWAWAPPSCR